MAGNRVAVVGWLHYAALVNLCSVVLMWLGLDCLLGVAGPLSGESSLGLMICLCLLLFYRRINWMRGWIHLLF